VNYLFVRIVRYGAGVLTILLLAGCGLSPKAEFYHLDLEWIPAADTGQGIVLGIEPITLASYLDRPQIVTRAGQYQLQLSEFNRWSEPLQNSIIRVVKIGLGNFLHTHRIYPLPRKHKTTPLDYRISIDILRFDGQPGGEVTLVAHWIVYGQNDRFLYSKMTVIHELTNKADYRNLVAAQNRALQQLTQEIALIIKHFS